MPTHRRGVALPMALFGLVILTMLGAGIFGLADMQALAVVNREGVSRALMLAEEGVAHAVAVTRDSLRTLSATRLLRGSDDIPGTSDDGRLRGNGLSASVQIPDTGIRTTAGRYSVQLLDDPNDPIVNPLGDGNSRFIARCVATTPQNASAALDVTIGATPMPAIAAEGNLALNGNPSVLGPCGGAHANGNLTISGTTTTTGSMSATGSASGNAETPAGVDITPLSGQPRIDIDSLNPMDWCGAADYDLFANGTLRTRATGVTVNATGSPVNGWRRTGSSPVVWTGSGNSLGGGTYCVQGNVTISGNTGSASSPLALTILASGSVQVSGNPYIIPDLNDISIMAGGDVSIAGNSNAANENYEGMIYAGAQCLIAGTPRIGGNVQCDNRGNPSGAAEYALLNEVNGNPEIVYSCGSSLARRKILGWIQVVN